MGQHSSSDSNKLCRSACRLHIHPRQNETFLVKQGRMGYQAKDKEHFLEEGQTVTIPSGLKHTFWNANFHKDLLVEITLTPALHAEEFFRTFCGLGIDYGGTLSDVNPLQLMLTFEHGGVELADVPRSAILANRYFVLPMAQWVLGFKPFYDEYTMQQH